MIQWVPLLLNMQPLILSMLFLLHCIKENIRIQTPSRPTYRTG